MNMSKWTKWLIGGVAGLFLGAVGLGLGTAIAVAATSAETPAADPGLEGLGWPGHGFGLVDMQALLAEELGIAVEELQAAQAAAREAAIQQLVEAGVLTEEQGELAAAGAALRCYLWHRYGRGARRAAVDRCRGWHRQNQDAGAPGGAADPRRR